MNYKSYKVRSVHSLCFRTNAPLVAAIMLSLSAQVAWSNSATWKSNPPTGDWNTANNWAPTTVPNSPSDVATFISSSKTSVALTADTELNGITFNAAANPYTVTANGFSLTFSGVGITNNSGTVQSFVAQPQPGSYGDIKFQNNATAGSLTSFTIKGPNSNGYYSQLFFYGTSSAGSGNFTMEDSAVNGYYGAQAYFYDNSNLDNASFTLLGAATSEGYGASLFYGPSASNAVTGNFVIGGATAGNTFLGSSMLFQPGSVTDVDGNFTVGGGTAPTALGGTLVFFPGSVNNVTGDFTVGGGGAIGAIGGYVKFYPQSGTNLTGRFTVNGGTASGVAGGRVEIKPSGPLIGGSSFTINGGTVAGALGGYMECDYQDSGNRTYTANGGRGMGSMGGQLYFYFQPGLNGTLVANGGTQRGGGGSIYIYTGTAGTHTPRLKAFGNGTIDLSGWYANSYVNAVSSIEGSGIISLGGEKLTVGSDNLSSTFSGMLKDGGSYSGSGAALTKVGTGTLTLSGGNSYTGGTAVVGGTLLVNNIRGSGTGIGPVTVTTSTLGGIGIIKGAVTVGSNSGPDAYMAPGDVNIGTLTIKKTLKLNKNAIYNCELDSNTATADNVSAKGVSINSLSQIFLSDIGTAVIASGTVFTIIDNTANTPITGTFGNLADGSTLTVGSNTYRVSYEGGSGNDLTLTVQ
ncbi:MAG TPA: autotransporter-associated beta strand repeat-containing protein [Candidatus Udaeobacter sp.]|nr:autotransporter-associated beta strand repeat-containing protein [Candidatus Udaeobacter sp.]